MSNHDSRPIHHGHLISLYSERVNHPNGSHSYFDIVKHPGGAVIAAINEHQQICLLKQWRHAVGQFIWEFPAGCLEPDEAPLLTAQRELEEETGWVANNWQNLGELIPSPGFSNEVLHLFLAKDLSKGKRNLDDAEQLEAHWFSLEEIKNMVNTKQISDAKTLALLYKLNF